MQGKSGISSPDLSLLSLDTGSSGNIADEPTQIEATDDGRTYPVEPVSEPESGPESDEAPLEEVFAAEEVFATVEEAYTYTVEEVPAPLDDAWGFPTTAKSGVKKKKKSKN